MEIKLKKVLDKYVLLKSLERINRKAGPYVIFSPKISLFRLKIYFAFQVEVKKAPRVLDGYVGFVNLPNQVKSLACSLA